MNIDDFKALNLTDASLFYKADFLSTADANQLYEELYASIPWQQDSIKVFGKTHLQPRLTAFFATNQANYHYSSIVMHPAEFPPNLLKIKEKIEQISGISFTSCLANLYRDGSDSNGWHADDEKELGKNPPIASLSLGANRFFKFRRKDDKKVQHKLVLEHGSLLLMQGTTQHFWQHQLPKTQRKVSPRINLTFRRIL